MDGAVFSHIRGFGFGVGVVIHDHEGRVAVAVSKKLLQPLGPLEIEANAMEI